MTHTFLHMELILRLIFFSVLTCNSLFTPPHCKLEGTSANAEKEKVDKEFHER